MGTKAEDSGLQVSDSKESFQMAASGSLKSQQSARDNATLARLGKKPVLKRNFGFITILGFSCTVLVTWEGVLSLFLVGLSNGGPGGLVYGYIVVWLGTISVFATLSELTSMAPTSGGQYHWVSLMAPPSSRKFLSYITGWVTIAGWQGLVASGCFLSGTMIQGLIVLTHPEYLESMQNWHGTLLYWGVVLWAYIINTALTSLLAKFEGMVLVLHILGFFSILFPLVLLTPEHATTDDVFNTFLNMGEWPTMGLSFCVGITGHLFAFLGADGAIHLAEEIRNAELVLPRSLMTSLFINGTLGFAMLIALLFSMGDLDSALARNPAYPYMSIFESAVGSTTGAAVMSSLILVMGISATTGSMASASRLIWAFSRDRGLPGWETLKKVSPRTGIPRIAVITTAVVSILLSFVNIGSPVAFNGVISISIGGILGSYLIAAALLLYRRAIGSIGMRHPEEEVTHMADSGLTWGPWRIPGIVGTANNAFTVAYLIFVEFFIFWPGTINPTVQSMNWAILPFGAVIIFSIVYYFAWAKKVYTGPIREI
ncbi:amino acid transporter-like protein [Podospora appendiculata]|uniref:Amino acid transporter-like protein n=1 Tax=Podospora appendiculata TaxID=314037 RepID=A0AAE0X7W2_9PEZI|nr:amino acid transporter-like protein [Podospora appendiculata]